MRRVYVGLSGRFYVLMILAETIVGLLLAMDPENWMRSSAWLVAAALMASGIATLWPTEHSANLAGLVWFLAVLVSLRWLAHPIVYVPLFALTILGLPIVVRAELRKWAAIARQLDRRCMACGYDLRASPDRCPECGTDVRPEAERMARIRAAIRGERPDVTPPSSRPAAGASGGRR